MTTALTFSRKFPDNTLEHYRNDLYKYLINFTYFISYF